MPTTMEKLAAISTPKNYSPDKNGSQQERPIVRIPGRGTGTELKKLLAWFRITDKGGCGCEQRAQTMDANGPDWCEENIDTIVGWLKENADKRSLPFVESAARRIVKMAIRKARKDPIPAFMRSPQGVIGTGFHVQGWPYAFSFLTQLKTRLLIDDFVEQTFVYCEKEPTPHEKPWVGFFHHPGDFPRVGIHRHNPSVFGTHPAFLDSLEFMVCGFALTESLADWWEKQTGKPFFAVKYPYEEPKNKWTMKAWEENSNQSIVQAGWYLRNTRCIYQVPRDSAYSKIRLLPKNKGNCIPEYDATIAKHWRKYGGRQEFGGVFDFSYVPAAEYIQYFTENIIIMENFASSANTVVMDCIMMNTPLLINKNPSVIEYLGEDYPLYFEHPEQVPELVQSIRVRHAHEHLQRINKKQFAGEFFRKQVQARIHQAVKAKKKADAHKS